MIVAELAISAMAWLLIDPADAIGNSIFLFMLLGMGKFGLPAVVMTLVVVALRRRRERTSNASTGIFFTAKSTPTHESPQGTELAPAPAKFTPAKVAITQERLRTLEKLIRVSSRVKIDDMAGVLELPRAELLRKLLDLSGQFHFRIEEDVVEFEAGASKDDFSNQLEHPRTILATRWSGSSIRGQRQVKKSE